MSAKLKLLFFLCLSAISVSAQQTIRGTVLDAFTDSPLQGVVVQVVAMESTHSDVSNVDGSFEIQSVPLGRCSVKASLLGYNETTVSNIMLVSGKETQLTIKLEEKVMQLNEVTVTNKTSKRGINNDMSLISARTFSTEETERFAGSLGDPARMVANYAGVMAGNDSRNDIVIRGNSPLGVLWRIDGVDIPNPNHFGAQGTTGGAVSMLNSNLLSNSDFLTGAFPAEYGNAISGVFDLNMRNGNNKKYEFTGQVGFNGFEGAIEGPIHLGKNNPKGSFIVDYRYSTLDLVSKMGFDLGTGTAIPEYQDFAALVNLPTKNAGRFRLIALVGKSKIQLGRSFDPNEGVAHSDFGTATDFGASLAFGALTHTYYFDEDTKLKNALAINVTGSQTVFDTVNYVDKKYFTLYNGTLTEYKYTASTELKKRFSNKNSATFGLKADLFVTHFTDSAWLTDYNIRVANHNINGRKGELFHAYAELQHKFSNSLALNGGIYSQYYDLNNELAVEPRAAIRWQPNSNQALNLGYGMHSQLQSRIIYYNQDYDNITGAYSENNLNLKSTKAQHFVLGYEYNFAQDFRLKIESYYQHLYDIPVSKVDRQYSVVNLGAEYYLEVPDSLVSSGKGKNYGLELTVEKFLNQGYYLLFSASVFDSKYKGSDGVWRNTSFNTNYVFNLLGGYEWKINKNNFITFDVKNVWSGGRRKTPIDLAASRTERRTIYDNQHAFEDKLKDYFRTDFRIGFKINSKKSTQEWALDLQNITNHRNIYSESYNQYSNQVAITYQQSFMPMMLYRINF